MFKDTKFWMYLPFTCFTIKLLKRCAYGKTYEERANRVFFYFFNFLITLIFSGVVIGLILRYI